MNRLIMVDQMVDHFDFGVGGFTKPGFSVLVLVWWKLMHLPETGWTIIEVTWWLSCGPMSLGLKLIFGAGRPVNTMQISQKVGVFLTGWADRFTPFGFWRLNIAKPSSLMKDEVLTSSLTKKAMVTCVNQFFMLCSKKVFMPCFIEYLGDIFWWNASTVFRPVWLQEPYLALDRIWALLHQRPEQANAATPEGKPMTLAVKKGTESTTTQRHTTKLWNIWVIVVEFLTQGVVIQVCTFVMIHD